MARGRQNIVKKKRKKKESKMYNAVIRDVTELSVNISDFGHNIQSLMFLGPEAPSCSVRPASVNIADSIICK